MKQLYLGIACPEITFPRATLLAPVLGEDLEAQALDVKFLGYCVVAAKNGDVVEPMEHELA